MDLTRLETFKENNRLEAKAAQGGLPKSIWESLCAFANTSGGVIVLGVREREDKTLEIAGLSDAHKMLDDFWNAAMSDDKLSAKFLQDKDVHIETIAGKDIIVIEVPSVDRVMRPVFLNKDILGETWRRTHTGDHRCSREEVQSMLRDAGMASSDSRVADKAEMGYLDYETVRKYRNRFEFRNEGHIWNDASDEEFLTFLGAAGKDSDGILRPTYAGILMFGRDHWITRVLPGYFLDYRQETSPDMRWEDRFTSFTGDWSGNIYDFYIRIYNKLKAALKVPFRLEGIERVDDTPAHEALREAIVNCVTNADFHIDRGIVCVWKDDALIIANPGGFRIPIEKAMLPGESNPRNTTLLKMFAMIDAGERAGSGISKIYHGWREAGYSVPSYEEEFDPDRTILTLPLTGPAKASLPGDSSDKKSDESIGRINRTNQSDESTHLGNLDRQAAIIAFLKENGSSTRAEIADAIGLKASRTSEILAEAVAKGLVIAEGKTKNRRFRVSEDNGVSPNS